ncbi:unnamed protein product [Rotaria socialis]|uniref:Integrase catalytic domain-containing protein n=1 Tax=Rotaria socialis TaxID=392032 RepID=A0A821WGA0_9BILA|nr:unnamed protein product [Rotaria socialis]
MDVNLSINSLQVDFPGQYVHATHKVFCFSFSSLLFFECIIVHGRPRHPQSQGLIERVNAILTDALGKWMEDNSSNHWSLGLPSVIFRINIRKTHTPRKTLYQLVVGQNPRTNAHSWQSLHDAAMNDDVEMNDLIIEKLVKLILI